MLKVLCKPGGDPVLLEVGKTNAKFLRKIEKAVKSGRHQVANSDSAYRRILKNCHKLKDRCWGGNLDDKLDIETAPRSWNIEKLKPDIYLPHGVLR